MLLFGRKHMKKLSVLFLALLLCLACSSGNSGSQEVNDSDRQGTADTDPAGDPDSAVVPDTDGPESPEPVYDADNAATDSDTEKDDSDPAESGICSPNPCDTAENQAAHKTRCMPENNGTSYTCVCDASYYSSDGLCCQPHSSNKGGKCTCDNYYVELEEEPGKCIAECSENTLEGLGGYCKDGFICQQGTCIKDRCAGYTCPENSTCTTKNDEAFCQCDAPLQMSSGKCCPLNSTNVNGTCKCDAGYELSGNECVMSADNPCRTKPCKTLNKNKCVADNSEAGYHCECNENFTEDETGKCNLIVYDVCPNGMQCLRGYCLPQDLSNEQCVKDSDCREFNEEATSYCSSPGAAGGVCMGCTAASDCPGNTQCMENFGTCALECTVDDDCPYGKCTSLGYCAQKKCYSNEDCFGGTVCKMGEDGYGYCNRLECHETACSETNPGGSCPNQGEACINGSCVSSCEPNPCGETNRTKCEKKLGVPTCVCDEGTVEKNGKCQPKTVQTCPSGFVCKNGYCADKSEGAFFCAENFDCGGSLTCSPKSPSGTCNGCNYTAECPSLGEDDPVSCLNGYCMRGCLTDYDCNPGMICKTNSQGSFCGTKTCSKPSDCPENYTCTPSAENSGSGMCTRKPCE